MSLNPTKSEETEPNKPLQRLNFFETDSIRDESNNFDEHSNQKGIVLDGILFLNIGLVKESKIPQTHNFLVKYQMKNIPNILILHNSILLNATLKRKKKIQDDRLRFE